MDIMGPVFHNQDLHLVNIFLINSYQDVIFEI